MLAKPRRIEDKNFIDWIHTRGCLICGETAEAHHMRSKGAGGHDYGAIPLCRKHHREYHDTGNNTWHLRHAGRLVWAYREHILAMSDWMAQNVKTPA